MFLIVSDAAVELDEYGDVKICGTITRSANPAQVGFFCEPDGGVAAWRCSRMAVAAFRLSISARIACSRQFDLVRLMRFGTKAYTAPTTSPSAWAQWSMLSGLSPPPSNASNMPENPAISMTI